MTLVEEIKKREHVVMAKIDTKVTAQTKAFAWQEITDCVNSVSRVHRTPDDVRNKFKDQGPYPQKFLSR